MPDRQQLLRLLDMNLNRAMEGLRTIEDLSRVIFENASCAARTKALRHDLAAVSMALPRLERLAARNVREDAGTATTTVAEQQREDWSDIVAAACERVLQSMRCLEEFSKPLSSTLAADFKTLRYRAYDDLAEIELYLSGQREAGAVNKFDRLAKSRLYLLVSCSLPLELFATMLVELAQAGVDMFQLRDKQADAATLMQYATAAVACLAETSAIFIVNDRLDIALAAGADGVHLGQEDLGMQVARRLAGSRLLIGISTHDLQQAERAVSDGADYIGCGPTFPSKTKDFGAFAGLPFLEQIAGQFSIPAFAVGGIDESNVEQVKAIGISRIAVSHAILGSHSPRAAARRLHEQLSPES